MPIIDEREVGTDRARRAVAWPWVLVVAGASLLWLLIAGLVTVLSPRRRDGAAAPQAVQRFYADQVARAKSLRTTGDAGGAARLFLAIPADAEMETMAKHDYLVDGLSALERGGHAARAVELGERLFRFSSRLYTPECAGCHGTNRPYPLTLEQLPSGASGQSYRRAARRTRAADEIRKRFEKALEKAPEDPGTLIPLLALEEGRSRDSKRVAELSHRLAELSAQLGKEEDR